MAKQDPLPRIADEESPSNSFFASSSRCFHLPCFAPRRSPPSPSPSKSSLWERLALSDAQSSSPRWWSKPFRAIRKLREWSEIVAGPKWKTFIRRFNRNRASTAAARHGDFQYDPLSYALNFDEGPAQVYQTDEDYGYYPDFASRYVSASSKTSLDLGRDGGNLTPKGC